MQASGHIVLNVSFHLNFHKCNGQVAYEKELSCEDRK
jgi:hypothetical protein